MKIRDVVLQDEYAVNDDGTWTFNVNLVDPVTEFKIWFEATNHATAPVADSPIPRVVQEVAVIDGSEVIASMNGEEAVALYGLEYGEFPYQHNSYEASDDQRACIPITFGRSLTDPEWIFDPTRFRNPQIRVTWDLTAINAIGANGFATGTGNISVWAKVMEEGANPRGYLMSKEIKEFSTAAAGDEVTYLPTDFPLRKLLVRAYESGVDMATSITNLKLSQDEDKFVAWDLEADEFIWLMHNWFEPIDRYSWDMANDGAVVEHFMGHEPWGVGTAGIADLIFGMIAIANGQYTVESIDNAGASVDPGTFKVKFSSRTPFNSFAYPFGDQNDAADWLQVRDIGNLRLLLTQGNAGADCQIVVQQAHPY